MIWGRSFTYSRKRSGSRIEPCGAPYFNVPVSEKTSIQTKNFLFERSDSNHLIKDAQKPKYFIFLTRTPWSKYQMLSEDLVISYRYPSVYPYQLQQSLSTELEKGLLNDSF